MFEDRESGREQPCSFDGGPAGSFVLQPVCLKPAPFESGAWVLPGISANVPLVLSRGASASDVNGAVFALEAHASGVRLPAGDFTTVKDSLKQQLSAHVSKHCDPDEPVKMDFHLVLSEEEIELVLSANSSCEVVVLRPIIERLNEHADGLGWFVYETISKAGGSYPIYNDASLLAFCDMLWFDPDQTDAEYAEDVLNENGEERDGRSDQEIIDSFTAGFRPSDVHEMIGDNMWMLGTHRYENGLRVQFRKKPKSMSLRAVNRLLQQDMPHDLVAVVKDAIALRKQVTRKDQRVFGATSRATDTEDHDHAEPYGAACIAVWNWTDFAGETINHFEECLMSGGESDIHHMHFKARADDEKSVKELVKSFKDVVAWHGAVGRVLKHFPKGD